MPRALAVDIGGSLGEAHQNAENATSDELAGSLQNSGLKRPFPLTYWRDTYVPDFRKNSVIHPIEKLGTWPAFALAFLCATLLAATTAPAAFADPPVVSITSPADNALLSDPDVELTFDATGDTPLVVTCTINGGLALPCTSPFAIPGFPDGEHTIEVSALDLALQTGSDTVSFEVDSAAPSIAITSPTAGQHLDADAVSLEFDVTDANPDSVECRVDGGAFNPCVTGELFSGLSEGSHTFDIQATDMAGHIGTASVTVTLDQTDPMISFSVPAEGEHVPTGSPEVDFSVSDDAPVTIECSVDGGSFSPCSAPFHPDPLPEGSHFVTVLATDPAGNSTSESVTFVVDLVFPVVEILNPLDTALVDSTNLDVEFAVTELHPDAIECEIDSQGSVPCASPWSASGLSDGQHFLTVGASDLAGNYATSTVSFTVDTTKPTLEISSPIDGDFLMDDAFDVEFSASDANGVSNECQVNGGGFATCTSPYPVSSLGEGDHTIDVRATDDAGNFEVDSVSVTVDQTLPAVAISSPLEGAQLDDANPTVAFSAIDANLDEVTCTVDGGTPAACSSQLALSGLADGAHTVSVHASDRAGNSASASVGFTIDTTDPNVSIDSPADDAFFNTGDVDVEFTATDANLDSVECRLDGGAFSACSSPLQLTGLSESEHTVDVRATDVAGNSASDTVTFTVESVPPVVSITSPTSGQYFNSSSVTVSFSATDTNLRQVRCSIDGGAFQPCSSPRAYSGLGQGAHTVSVRATDKSGNETVESVTFNVDTIVPIVSIASPTEGQHLATTSVSVSFTATDASALNVECSLDGGSFSTCSSPHNYSDLDHGSHELVVRATDPAGNSSSVTRRFVIDTTPPSVSIGAPSSGQYFDSTSVPVSFSATDDHLASVGCAIDGGAFSSCTSPRVFSSLTQGSHPVEVRATDLAGNSSTASVTFVVDTVDPAVSVSYPAANAHVASQDIDVQFTATDANSLTVSCSVDGGAFSSCASPLELTALEQGQHTVVVRAVDPANNVTDVSRTFTVDTVAPAAPTVTRTSPTANPTNSTSQTISFSGVEPGGTLECKLDSGDFEPCASSPASVSGLADGSHTYSVRQIDAAGNVGAVGSVTWTVDTIAPAAPVVTRTSPTASPVSSTSQTISYSGAEPGGTFECRLDAAAFSDCPASPLTLSDLTQGSHTYSVRQVDAAGNAGVIASVTWTVDTIAPAAPTVTRTSPTANPTNSTSQTISFSTAEPGGTRECRLDSGSYEPCSASPVTLSNLADGSHTFSVRQTDAAGNIGAVGSVIWTVDTIAPAAPTVTRTSPTADPASSTSQTISYTGAEPGGTYQCRLDGGSFAGCPASPVTLTALSQGQHTYSVRQLDAAGNLGSVASVTWTVDTIAPSAPTVTRTTPTASPTNSTSQTISFSAAESGGTLECRLDGNVYQPCAASPVTLSGLSDGPHTYSVRQTDEAGNVGAVGSVTWTVDTIAPAAPTVTRTSPTANPTNSTSQTISYSGAEPGGTFRCELDDVTYMPCPASPVTIDNLTDGSHTASVRQIDAAGNVGAVASVTWIVDTDGPPAPTVTRTAPTATPTSSTSQTIEYSGNEPGGTFICRLDTAAYAACPASPLTLTGLADGVHTFYVRHVDSSGNAGAVASVTWTVDTTAPNAPTVTRSTPTANPTNSSSQTISFSAAEAGGTLDCRLDAGAFAPCTASPVTLSDLADGSHTYSVRQTDAAGNVGAIGSVAWTVDTIKPNAPTVVRSTPAASPTNVTSQSISYSGAEAGGSYQCRLDAASYAACGSSPVALSGLAEGSRSFHVRQIDAAGNVGDPATVAWVIDLTDPVVAAVTPANGAYVNVDKTGSASFTASDLHLSTVTCRINGDVVACPNSGGDGFTYAIGSLSDGQHDFEISALDSAGNDFSVAGSFTVDTIAPTVSITSPTAGVFFDTDAVTKSFERGDENLETVECRLDGGSYSGCTSPVDYTNLAEGLHTLEVRATDRAGNETKRTVQFTVDTIAPQLTITSPAAGQTVFSSEAAVAFTGVDATALTYECSANGSSLAACGNPFSFGGLGEGGHTARVRATDRAGNSSERTVQFNVDLTSPDRSEQFGAAKPKGKTPLKVTKRSRLIFRDEFDGSSLNRRKWTNLRGTLKHPYTSAYNIRKEAATYSRQNVAIENGRAVLTLKKKPAGEDPTHPYSSGMIHSGNHFSFKHGYVEARVLVPKCVGCWPAFWMLNAPVDEEWPPEIDIFEFFNTNKDKRPKVNFHWKTGNKRKQWGSKKYGDPRRSYVGRWHTYGLHWTSKKAQVFVDGRPGPVFKLSRHLPKKPNYLIFNLALQKGFNPTGERRMMIDYVRVWQ